MPALTQVEAPTFIDRLHGQAVANDGLLLLTDDGGKQWRTVRAPYDPAANLLLFNDPRTGWLFQGSRVSTTTDGGATWQALPDMPLHRLGFQWQWTLGPTRLVVTGYSFPWNVFESTSLLSEDGGRTWSPLPLRVDHVEPSGLMYGEESPKLLLSSDGGKSARSIFESTVDEQLNAKDLSDPKRLQLIVFKVSSGDFEHRSSSDGGLTWTRTPVSLPPLAYTTTLAGTSLQGDIGWASATTASSRAILLRSEDGGRQWSTVQLPDGLSGATFLVHAGSVLSAQSRHEAWISRDSAKTWQRVQPLSDPSEIIELQSVGGGVLHASTGERKVEMATPCPPPFISRCLYEQTTIHRRYVSTDGGATWRLMPGGRPITP
jgi:photosystem II stability/assembly factor-like uncharacterized protein